MGMIDSAWFYEKLAEKGASLRDMSRFMALDPSAVSRMLNGDRKMSAEEQDRIAEFLGISIEEVAIHRRSLASGFGEKAQPEYVPRLYGEKDGAEDNVSGSATYRHPIFGCMKGTMTIPPDLDLTAPADPDWGKIYEDD